MISRRITTFLLYNKARMHSPTPCARLRPMPSIVDHILQYCSDGTLRKIKLFARATKGTTHSGHRRLYTSCTYEYMRRVHHALQKYALRPWRTGAAHLQILLNGETWRVSTSGHPRRCPTIEVPFLRREPLRALFSRDASSCAGGGAAAAPVFHNSDACSRRSMRVHSAYRLPLHEVRHVRSLAPSVLALIY